LFRDCPSLDETCETCISGERRCEDESSTTTPITEETTTTERTTTTTGSTLGLLKNYFNVIQFKTLFCKIMLCEPSLTQKCENFINLSTIS
jgi:hypothetical protein